LISVYDSTFNKLTERFFKSSYWPDEKTIAPLVNNDKVFLMLYKELYYRHIYSKREQPTMSQRHESWVNYCNLFDYIMNEGEKGLALPHQWLWDMIDEFIYQFQTFVLNRSKVQNKTAEEVEFLKNNPNVWGVTSVLRYLHALRSESNILALLKHDQELEPRDYSVLQALGYFSIIGLLRVHCLLGDYTLALRMLEPLDLTKKGLFSRVAACHISLYYYMGFAYLMMRRYVAAVQAFTNILVYISRTHQYHRRSYQYPQIVKKNDHIFYLLAVAVSLCPRKIRAYDDNIEQTLREKCGDKIQRIQRGDPAPLGELFAKACPKFITPAQPDWSTGETGLQDYHQNARNLQMRVFMEDVQQQAPISTVRSYLKLYTTISIAKLASFLDVDEATFRNYLLCFKHKTRMLAWSGGSALSGDWTTSSDVTFYLDKGMVHIADSKVARHYADFFMRNINKFEAINNRLARKEV